MIQYIVRILEDQTIEFSGVSFSGKTTLVEYNEEAKILVVFKTGGKYWSSIGRQSYAPAVYKVFRVRASTKETWGTYLTVEQVMEFPARRSK